MIQYDLQSCSCPSCGGGEFTERFSVRDLRDRCGPDTFYVRCAGCRSLYLNPRPICVSSSSSNSYNERYRRLYSQLVRKLQHPLKRQFILRIYALLTGPVHLYQPGEAQPGQTLLDIGCGLGLQTKYLAERGVKITGLDKSDQAIEFARQLAGPMEEFLTENPFELNHKHSYDYIRMDNVLEHIEEPRPFLQRIRDLLRPQGHLLLFTPNADSWSLRWLKGRSVLAWSPEHLTLYSRTGIERILEETGFRITKVLYNTPAWWVAYNLALLLSLQQDLTADSAVLKVGSLILLPFVRLGQCFGMNEELIVEAERLDKF